MADRASDKAAAFVATDEIEIGMQALEYQYKNFTGVARYDSEAEIFHGNVIGIRDVITFQSRDEATLEAEFILSVKDYLDFVEKTS